MDKKPVLEREYLMFGLKIMGNFGAIIAVPIILFVLGGRWLDERFGKGILFTVIAFVLALIFSGISIVRKSREYGKQYQDLVNRDQ